MTADKDFKKEFSKLYKNYDISESKKGKFVFEYYAEEESSENEVFENIYECLKAIKKVKNNIDDMNILEIKMEDYK